MVDSAEDGKKSLKSLVSFMKQKAALDQYYAKGLSKLLKKAEWNNQKPDGRVRLIAITIIVTLNTSFE